MMTSRRSDKEEVADSCAKSNSKSKDTLFVLVYKLFKLSGFCLSVSHAECIYFPARLFTYIYYAAFLRQAFIGSICRDICPARRFSYDPAICIYRSHTLVIAFKYDTLVRIFGLYTCSYTYAFACRKIYTGF